jgi:phosphinothricin acetyltransferase
MQVIVQSMTREDWPEVRAIYAEGIATGQATFAPSPPDTFDEFSDGKRMDCAVVVRDEMSARVLGWGTLASVSDRCVYAGVAEVSVYVAAAARGRGVGAAVLGGLIARSEAAGMWTLQAGVFPENAASIALHRRFGFRVVGTRERVGKMTHGPCAGQWRDTVLLERRSAITGRD